MNEEPISRAVAELIGDRFSSETARRVTRMLLGYNGYRCEEVRQAILRLSGVEFELVGHYFSLALGDPDRVLRLAEFLPTDPSETQPNT